MKLLSLHHAFVGLAFYTTHASGLSVTPGSQCESACSPEDGSATATTASDIVCQDNEYDTTEEGRRFKRCVECLKDSEHTKEKDSDLSALLCSSPLLLVPISPQPSMLTPLSASQLPIRRRDVPLRRRPRVNREGLGDNRVPVERRMPPSRGRHHVRRTRGGPGGHVWILRGQEEGVPGQAHAVVPYLPPLERRPRLPLELCVKPPYPPTTRISSNMIQS